MFIDQQYCETLNGENFCQTCKKNAGFVMPDNKTCQGNSCLLVEYHPLMIILAYSKTFVM